MNCPIVSVIVPAYNADRFLSDAIRSITEQNYSPLQIIVVNDGSTDGTAEIANRLGDRIEYVFQENRGPAAARNRGIDLARGEFIAFLDADDLWVADKLIDQVSFLQRNAECDVVLGRMQYEWLEDAKERDPLHQAPITTVNLGAGLFRRGVFDRVGTFDETLRFAEDHDWFLRAREAAISIRVLDRTVLVYRRHGNNMTLDEKAARLPIAGVLQRSLNRRRERMNGDVTVLPNWNDLDSRCPLVTVVVPAFNGARYIDAALRSAWEQNYRPIDLVVIDDGSTDNTAAIASAVPHVRVIRQSHKGVAAARNLGVETARSELVAFLDQDDLWLPAKLRAQVDVLLNQPVLGFVLCGAQPPRDLELAENESHSENDFPESGYHVSSLVVRKSVFQKIGFFDSRFLYASDADWFLRAKSNRIPMNFLEEALFTMRVQEVGGSLQSIRLCELAEITANQVDQQQGVRSATA